MVTGPPFIVVSAPKGDHVIARDQIAKISIGLHFGADGSGLIDEGSSVVLALYDLDLYNAHQQQLAEAALSGGLHEIDDTFFSKERDLPFTLKDHKVRAGTGLMFLAKLTMVKKPKKVHGTFWAVEDKPETEEHSNQAFKLLVELETKTSGGFDATSIGIASLAKQDFDRFLRVGGTRRKIAVRLLSRNLKKVLLCNMHPELSPAGVAKPVLYIEKPAASDDEEQVFVDRRQEPDLTGLWLEDPPSENKRRADNNVPEIVDVRAPATLYLNQAGHSVVGWYVPERAALLDNEVIPKLFDANVREEMLTTRPSCLLGGVTPREIKLDLDFSLEPRPDQPMAVIFSDGTHGFDGLDPLAIFHIGRRQQLLSNALRVRLELQEFLGGLIKRLVISVLDAQDKPVRQHFFIRSNHNSRIPNAVINELTGRSANLEQFRQELKEKLENAADASLPDTSVPSVEQVIESIIERSTNPTSPGVMNALVRQIIGTEMTNLLERWIDAKNDSNESRQRVIEPQISQLLERIMFRFRAAEMPIGVAQCKRLAAMRTFFHDAGNHGYMETLEEIVGAMLRRMAGGPGREDQHFKIYETRIAGDRDLMGFALWGIAVVPRFEYKFKFTELSESLRLGVLKGSAGGFVVTISATDTRRPVAPVFVAKMVGVFAGGGLGAGYSHQIGKKATNDPAGGGPVSCTIKTHLRLDAVDFDWAVFNTLSLVKPSLKVSGGPISLGNDWHETVFGVTLFNRSPTTTLEAVIEADPSEIKDDVTVNSVKDHIKDWAKAIKDGDVNKVPTPGINAHLASLTGSIGILLPIAGRDSEKDVYEVEEGSLPVAAEGDLPFHWQLQSPAFQRGKHHLLPMAQLLLDHIFSSYRKLLEQAILITFDGATSPEFGKLDRQQAGERNLVLSRRRADVVVRALQAALGELGDGVLNAQLEVKVRGHAARLHKQTDDPGDLSPGTILNPFCDAALDKDNLEAQERLRRESGNGSEGGTNGAGVYRYLRRVDFQIAGFLAARIVEYPWKVKTSAASK